MTVSRLKELIKDVDGDVQVLIPISQEFDGAFYSPCSEASGLTTMGIEYITEDEANERELLGKDLEEEDIFLLIPCGFDEEKDHSHELN